MNYSDGTLSPSDVALITGNTGNNCNNGWGENGAWWIILFLIFGWGRNGYGSFGGNSGGAADNYVLASDFAQIDRKLDTISNGICDSTFALNNTMTNGFAATQQTLCQGFSGINQAINTNGYETRLAVNGLSAQLADCCCGIQRSIDGVNYNMAKNTCDITNAIHNSSRDIIDNQNANYRAIHDELVANKIEAKNDRIAELQQQVTALQFSASQQAQNAFITANQEAQTAELIRRLGRDCPVPAFVVPNPNCCYPTNYNSCGCNSCGY